MSTIIYF